MKSAEKIVALAEQMGGVQRPLPLPLSPMLAKIGSEADLTRSGAAFELKFDGARAVVSASPQKVSIRFRKGAEVASAFPEVVEKVKELDAVIDGELVSYDDRGLPSFEKLAPRLHGGLGAPVALVAFDVLAIGGVDVRHLRWEDRRRLLDMLAAAHPSAVVPSVVFDNGPALYAWACERGLEGVMVKDRDSTYRTGERSPAWIKVKSYEEGDFIVVGYTRGENARDSLGALDVATFDEGGVLHVRGKVGSGLSSAMIQSLLPLLEAWTIDKCAAVGELERAPRGRVFVQPRLTIRVRYMSWTSEGRFRFPTFVGISSAPPEACTDGP